MLWQAITNAIPLCLGSYKNMLSRPLLQWCIQRPDSQAIQIRGFGFNTDDGRATLTTETTLGGFGGLELFQ